MYWYKLVIITIPLLVLLLLSISAFHFIKDYLKVLAFFKSNPIKWYSISFVAHACSLSNNRARDILVLMTKKKILNITQDNEKVIELSLEAGAGFVVDDVVYKTNLDGKIVDALLKDKIFDVIKFRFR